MGCDSGFVVLSSDYRIFIFAFAFRPADRAVFMSKWSDYRFGRHSRVGKNFPESLVCDAIINISFNLQHDDDDDNNDENQPTDLTMQRKYFWFFFADCTRLRYKLMFVVRFTLFGCWIHAWRLIEKCWLVVVATDEDERCDVQDKQSNAVGIITIISAHFAIVSG